MTNENVADAHGELRRLAEAATPGPWRSSGRYIGTKNHMSYIGECRDENGNWSDTEKSTGDSAFIAAANPAAILALLDELESLRHANVEHDTLGCVTAKTGIYAAPASPASAPVAPGLSGVTRYTVYENCHAPEGHEIEPAPDGDYILYADAIAALAAPVAPVQVQGMPEVSNVDILQSVLTEKGIRKYLNGDEVLMGQEDFDQLIAAARAAPLPPAAAPAPAEAEDQRDAGIILESATPAGPEGDSEAEDEMVTFTVAGQSNGFLEQVRRELASKFPDGVAAEGDSEASSCRMAGGICACTSGGSFGGCAKNRSDCSTNEPGRAPSSVTSAPCVICGSDEPRTGTCGSPDPRALCNAPTAPATGCIGDDAKFVALLDNYAQNGTDGYLLCLARIAAYVNRWADARSPVAAAPEEVASDDPLFDAGSLLLQTAQDFWDSARQARQQGAVQWVLGDDGALLIYTRGEYREQLMANIDKLSQEPRNFAAPTASTPPAHFDANDICQLPPDDWFCARKAGHDGPCAAIKHEPSRELDADDHACIAVGMARIKASTPPAPAASHMYATPEESPTYAAMAEYAPAPVSAPVGDALTDEDILNAQSGCSDGYGNLDPIKFGRAILAKRAEFNYDGTTHALLNLLSAEVRALISKEAAPAQTGMSPNKSDKPCRNKLINDGAAVWPRSCQRCGIAHCPDGLVPNYPPSPAPPTTGKDT